MFTTAKPKPPLCVTMLSEPARRSDSPNTGPKPAKTSSGTFIMPMQLGPTEPDAVLRRGRKQFPLQAFALAAQLRRNPRRSRWRRERRAGRSPPPPGRRARR